MMNLEEKKEQEIRNFVDILKQIDLPDIILLTRDANTLLMRQKETESRKLVANKQKEGDKSAEESNKKLTKYCEKGRREQNNVSFIAGLIVSAILIAIRLLFN